MLLGELIARFDDEVLASETLFSLGDLTLTARVIALAAEQNLTPGELASDAVGQFISRASDEDWLTLVGQMARDDNPGAVFLRRALAAAS
jgi:hypothetical protein